MASLVPDYGESCSGDSDLEETEVDETTTQNANPVDRSKVNYFDEGGVSSSDDAEADAEDGNRDEEEGDPLSEPAQRLPKPFFPVQAKLASPQLNTEKKSSGMGSFAPVAGASSSPSCSSVFVNPFQQAEQARLGILEKHVRLTEAAPHKPASKQICFKFKKGTCHLGHKCRFFHDRSAIVAGSAPDRSSATGNEHQDGDGADPGWGKGNKNFAFGRGEPVFHPAAQFSQGQPSDLAAADEDSYMKNTSGRKRHGVSDALVPPKKSMMALDYFRKKERPWTVGQ